MEIKIDKRVALYARAVVKGERTLESIGNAIVRAEVAKAVAKLQQEKKGE